MNERDWLYSFDAACREIGIYDARGEFHKFVAVGQVQPLSWWRAKWRAFNRALVWAEDARDERETMADALV